VAAARGRSATVCAYAANDPQTSIKTHNPVARPWVT